MGGPTMRSNITTLLAAGLAASLALATSGQTRTGRPPVKPAPVATAVAAVTPAAPAGDFKETFAISTTLEKWALDDPTPTGSVTVGGKPVSIADRQVADV